MNIVLHTLTITQNGCMQALVLLLLLLAAMTYNQVQFFQINDYANHYVDIEISGYRVKVLQVVA